VRTLLSFLTGNLPTGISKNLLMKIHRCGITNAATLLDFILNIPPAHLYSSKHHVFPKKIQSRGKRQNFFFKLSPTEFQVQTSFAIAFKSLELKLLFLCITMTFFRN